MKKHRFLGLVVALLIMMAFSFDASAWWPAKPKPPCPPKPPVNAPLDGGLLSILAVAGVSYFVIRKKKK